MALPSRNDRIPPRSGNARWSACLVLTVVLVPFQCAALAVAQQVDVPPTYMGREIAATMHYTGANWLVRESREREEDCTQMLKELRVRPGMTVCDLGCGNGFYSLRLAQLVGEKGSVLAVDIQSEMLRLLQARAAEANIENIQTLLGTQTDPKLPPDSVDLVLCVDVYHELSRPAEILKAVHAALKPSGQIVLVEFRAEDPEVPIKPLHKMSKAQILKELEANDYQLAREFDGLPWQHMMFFEQQDEGR